MFFFGLFVSSFYLTKTVQLFKRNSSRSTPLF